MLLASIRPKVVIYYRSERSTSPAVTNRATLGCPRSSAAPHTLYRLLLTIPLALAPLADFRAGFRLPLTARSAAPAARGSARASWRWPSTMGRQLAGIIRGVAGRDQVRVGIEGEDFLGLLVVEHRPASALMGANATSCCFPSTPSAPRQVCAALPALTSLPTRGVAPPSRFRCADRRR